MSARLVTHKNYVAGWLDTSIHDFLEVVSSGEPSTKYALITCLDSNSHPASLRAKSPELKPIAKQMSVLGSGLIVRSKALLEASSEQQIFFGFDEIWFFPNKDIHPKPDEVSLVGPARIDQRRLKRMAQWMSKNDCSLGLGGGEGLNFVVPASGMAKYLLGHSIEQPEPLFEPAKA